MGPSNGNMNGSWCPSNPPLHHSLKIKKGSHMIKKLPLSSSSSSSSLSPPKSQQRHPVIIYTHSPKVIHTQPKDFKSLVQALTGMSSAIDLEGDKKKINKLPISYCQDPVKGEESDSLSGLTTSDDTCNNGGDNSNCLGPPPPPPPPPPMAFHHSFIGLPLYPAVGRRTTNNSSITNNNNNNTDSLCCNSGSSTTTDPTYDFIDFNVPFN